jgi:N,N'-diacetylchitobiose phosphorylase
MSTRSHETARERATSVATSDTTAAAEKLLDNGRLRTLVTPTGAGATWLDELSLTRWRDDRLLDEDGEFVFVRDLESGVCWPIALRPGPVPVESGEIDEGPAWFAISREHDGIVARLQTWVDDQSAMVGRLIRLENRSPRTRQLELTTWHEIVLDRPHAFAAHPAFSKLFLQTECDPVLGVVLARRRPRSPGDVYPWLGHALWGPGELEIETSRVRFLGRGGDLFRAHGLRSLETLSGTTGNVLDPVFVQRRRTPLAAGESAEFVSRLMAAPTREAVVQLAESSRQAASPSSTQTQASPADQAPATPHSTTAQEPKEKLLEWNGHGGFSSDGSEYVIHLRRGPDGELRRPPMPWSNLLANEQFGCLVTEGGSITTWSGNSRTHRLTPWSNDPVRDPSGDVLYLRDLESGAVWSPLPGPTPGPGDYEVRHQFGSTSFHHTSDGLETIVDVFVPLVGHFRALRLRITNRGTRTRQLATASFQRLELGERFADRLTLETAFDAKCGALTGRQTQPSTMDRLAFATAVADGPVLATSHTADAVSFVGCGGSLRSPAALTRSDALDGRTGQDLEPCFAWRVDLEIAPGQTRVVTFLLGDSPDCLALADLLEGLRQPGQIDRLEREVRNHWSELVGRIRIETPVPALDLMVNGWLTYQTLACRLWGRTAFYQSGGAFGFRDQLQDATALLALAPEIARRQILLHAAHQFPEGDVLHWWHPPDDRGIRTQFADDRLWLPEATGNYIRTTGDDSILSETTGFVIGRELAPGEDEVFFEPAHGGEHVDLYEHCCRAIDRSLSTGEHGLPLFGSGDWNDGMNRVGREGRGESVWMAFFLHDVLGGFVPLCAKRRDDERIARYCQHQEDLRAAIERAWDGAWYRRGYYDDGTPLGSQSCDECQIDALVQAWSVLSGVAPRERAEQAMDSVMRHLVFERDGIIKLLTPAFDRTPHDPGYIKGYVPGVRENGGQYTHAALWVVRALAQLGRADDAARLLEMLSPVSHGSSEGIEAYQVEPYVIAADVYGEPPHVGRGGWTWYTGSAGWMLRVAVESVLGITVEGGDTLVIRPSLPTTWPGYRLTVQPLRTDTALSIEVRRDPPGNGPGIRGLLDGIPLTASAGCVRVPFAADGVHHEVTVFIDSNSALALGSTELGAQNTANSNSNLDGGR